MRAPRCLSRRILTRQHRAPRQATGCGCGARECSRMIDTAQHRAPSIARHGHQHHVRPQRTHGSSTARNAAARTIRALGPHRKLHAKRTSPPPRAIGPTRALDQSSSLPGGPCIVAQRDQRIDACREFTPICRGGCRFRARERRPAIGAALCLRIELVRHGKFSEPEDLRVDPLGQHVRQREAGHGAEQTRSRPCPAWARRKFGANQARAMARSTVCRIPPLR